MPRKDNTQEDYEDDIKQEVIKEVTPKVKEVVVKEVQLVTQDQLTNSKLEEVANLLQTVLQNQHQIFNALTGQQ